MEVMTSQRNTTLYVRGNFKFSFHKYLKDGVQRWRCIVRSCRAFLKFSAESALLEAFDGHTHDAADDSSLNRQRMSNSLKRKAIDDICSRPSKIVQRELQSAEVTTLQLSDIENIKQNIRRERRKKFHNLPVSRQEATAAVETLETRTNHGELLLAFADRDREILGFATPSNFNVLASTKEVYVDGTFQTCPTLFQQAAASSSKDAEVREHEAHLDAHVEDEPLINVPSGAEFESIVIKQEPIFGEEETPEPWAAHDPIEIPVKCETADPIQGEPPVPLDLEEDDLLYFKSLVPDLVKLTPELKDVFRMKVRNILKELTT
uniref:BESS domain-containing protein n=1 Tax=Lygus hesperus TaxID=30085 RepID=A0A146MFT3_LYGHE